MTNIQLIAGLVADCVSGDGGVAAMVVVVVCVGHGGCSGARE